MKNISIFAFFVLLGFNLQAQTQVLKVSTKNGKTAKTVDYDGPQIIDINSDVTIKIDKDSLRKKIATRFPQLGTELDLENQIGLLKEALAQESQILDGLKVQAADAQTVKKMYAALLNFYDFLTENPTSQLYKDVTRLMTEYTLNPSGMQVASGTSSKEEYVLQGLRKNLTSLNDQLEKTPKTVYFISMVAYLQTNSGTPGRVHIENFDTYAERDYYEVPRWVTTLSSQQLSDFQAIKQQAAANNQKKEDVFEQLKAQFLALIPELDCVKTVQTDITAFLNDSTLTNDITQAVKDKANEIITEYKTVAALLAQTKTFIENLSIESAFEIPTLVQQYKLQIEKIKAILTNFDQITQAIQALAAKATAVGQTVSTCVSGLTDFSKLLDKVLERLQFHQDSYKDNLDIDKNVLRFTLDNLPEEGFLRLKKSGQRDNGDFLELNLVIGLPKAGADPTSTNTDDYDKETLEPWNFQLQTLGLFSRTFVGMIMADPYNADSLSEVEALKERRFLYAPSAGLVLKVGSDSSRFWNQFLNPGVGIAIATPDFDTDGNPEFGVGGVLTAFNNILSVGIGYNVTVDVPYWYFGVNLPFNLPGVPINNPR